MDTERLMRRRFFTRFAGNPPARVCVEAKHASSHWKVEIAVIAVR
jgi:enamine deaminase RidA (YjgF/YER057c/UK114 family)